MKPKTEQLLQKAAQSIAAANLLLQGGQPEFAAARSYYAMFYVAEGAVSVFSPRSLRSLRFLLFKHPCPSCLCG